MRTEPPNKHFFKGQKQSNEWFHPALSRLAPGINSEAPIFLRRSKKRAGAKEAGGTSRPNERFEFGYSCPAQP